MKWNLNVIIVFGVVACCRCQRVPSVPLSSDSLRIILRGLFVKPAGRTPTVDDIILRHYTTNFSTPKSYKIGATKKLLANLDFKKPTVLYAHGYVEFSTDKSISVVVNAYLTRGGYNVLLLDWANLAFGEVLAVARNIHAAGRTAGVAVLNLLRGGVALDSLHFVGHSMGAHLLAAAARHLKARGYKIPRLTGLDPAYPGFYRFLVPIVAQPLNLSDAIFVDVIHTDGGGFGAPGQVGHADFWPNGGHATQPGCISATVPLTIEDFCSHHRSWVFWAESVTGGEFRARPCRDYNSFVRGRCSENLVYMGLRATINLRGNHYLRTADTPPYALGERGGS